MVLPSFVRRWMNSKGFTSPRGRQTATPPARRRPRLDLEALEDRRVPSTVMNLFDSGPGSLRQAIMDTPSGGTVDFQSGLTGTITLTSGELAISQNLTITGPGASVITVSGNHASRVFDIAATYTVSITGLTIANGNVVGASGGGISNAGTLAVSDCIVSDNSALNKSAFGTGGNGGGIFSNGTLTVSNSTIRDNSAQNIPLFGFGLESCGNGGGIFSNGTLSITNTTINNNSANNNDDRGFNSGKGGGILSNGTLTVSHSTIRDNSLSGFFGEGSAISSVGSLNLSDSTISGNSGGIIAVSYINGGTATVSDCSLTGNPSGQACIEGNGTLTVSNSTIAGNGGFGVWNGSGTATVSNSTIADNAGYGFRNNQTLTVSNSTITGNSVGGIENIAFGSDATALLVSTTVADNGGRQLYSASGFGTPVATATVQLRNTIVSSDGSGANVAAGPAGTFRSLGHNLSSDGGGGFLTAPGDLTNTDPRLGPLQDNGGPTQTMALLPGSPALNAGDPAQLGVADQRGVVRSGGVNIGAYQASASAFILTAPATATAGVPFDLVVTAVDAFGQTAVGYTGTVTFSTTDTNPAVVLPADYTFTSADAGMHTFAGATMLVSAGSQTVTATDTAASSITGAASVTVNPAAATHLVLSYSSNPVKRQAWSLTVTAYDAYGNVATGYTGTVTFSSSDDKAALPADYTFTAADAGTHTFSVTFHRLGQQSLTVTDTLDASIFGMIDVLVHNPGQDGH